MIKRFHSFSEKESLTSLNGSSLFVMSLTIFATFFPLLFTQSLMSAKPMSLSIYTIMQIIEQEERSVDALAQKKTKSEENREPPILSLRHSTSKLQVLIHALIKLRLSR